MYKKKKMLICVLEKYYFFARKSTFNSFRDIVQKRFKKFIKLFPLKPREKMKELNEHSL